MNKNLFASRWTRVALVLVLVVAVAAVSSAGTYIFMLERRLDEPAKEEAPPKRDAAESTAFSQMVESLKRQAHDAIFTPLYPERGKAITNIGDALKEIMLSDHAGLLTNDTFNSDEFSVAIIDYPLRDNKIIRKIQYVMKNIESGAPDEESRFFLQYIGEGSFFSDIEHSVYGDKELSVFENEDGCFAFDIFSTAYDYSTFSSTKKFSKYYANIYIPRNDAFSTEHIEIPLTVISGRDISLVQEDGVIKFKAVAYESEPECVFNIAALAFEHPKGNRESEPVGYDVPGLLLGLSDSQGKIRTLFIRKEGDKIRSDEYAGQIIFPREDKLFSLKPYLLYEDIFGDEFGGETDYRTGNIDIKKLLCAPLGIDLTDDFKKIFDSRPFWSYYGSDDVPLYVGEDYVCYIQNMSSSGGGTWHASLSDVRFDKLDNLLKVKYSDDIDWDFGRMIPNHRETTLAELIYGKKSYDLYQSDIRTYGGESNPFIDFRLLAVKRNLGKWSLMIPIMNDYYYPGNGSSSKYITGFAVYSNSIPAFLASNDEIIELGGWTCWEAKDLFKFPESAAALVQFDYFVGVCRYENDFFEFDISIPVDPDEYIVSINFADNHMQEAWQNELRKVG